MGANDLDSLKALRSFTATSAPITEAAIERFLAKQIEFEGSAVKVSFANETLNAGASGGTVLFQLDSPADGPRYADGLVLKYELGNASFFSQTSQRSQFEILQALRGRGLPVPDAIWLDEAGEIAGAPAIIMGRVRARAPSIQYMQAGPFVEADDAGRLTMLRRLLELGARIHQVDAAGLEAPSLATRGGEGQHFIDRQINWALAEMHAKFPANEGGERAELHAEIRTTIEDAAVWLRANAPRHRTPSLVHGDLTIANTMYGDDGSIVALLDWELAHLGLPETDVAYLLYAMHSIAQLGTPIENLPSLDDVAEYYRDAGGELPDWTFGRAMGAFCLMTWGAIGMRRMPREFWPVQRSMWRQQSGMFLAAQADFEADRQGSAGQIAAVQ